MHAYDIDCDLTAEEERVRDTVHRFAAEVLRPAGQTLDRLPADEVARHPLLHAVHRRWEALGVRLLTSDPGAFTPTEMARLVCLVNEELGWGDAGLAISIGAAEFPAMLAQASMNPELVERFPVGRIGCWAVTEPDHGSDVLDMHDGDGTPCLQRPNCVARRDGDDWVIDGQKAAWVSNAPVAEAAALYTALDEGDGVHGRAVFLVDLTAPGVSRGKPLEKLGQRPLPQGEIFFDGVRVPASHMVVPPAMYPVGLEMTLCNANGFMGATFVGCARAAFELAVDYAKQRIQGGRPIFEHQAVKLKLFEMFRKIEAARSLSRRTVAYNMANHPVLSGDPTRFPAVHFAIASKVTSTQTAFEVASEALQIFGGNGLSHEYPIEKILRDARASLIEDGANEVLSLHAAERL
jgi:acyl-CoA dehydrogenase